MTVLIVSDSRQSVMDALSTVPGLVVSPVMPETPQPGAAWPVWAESRPGGKLRRPTAHTYDAICLLTASHHSESVEAADGLVEQVMGALSTVGTVDVATPALITFDTKSPPMPGITCRVTVSSC